MPDDAKAEAHKQRQARKVEVLMVQFTLLFTVGVEIRRGSVNWSSSRLDSCESNSGVVLGGSALPFSISPSLTAWLWHCEPLRHVNMVVNPSISSVFLSIGRWFGVLPDGPLQRIGEEGARPWGVRIPSIQHNVPLGSVHFLHYVQPFPQHY